MSATLALTLLGLGLAGGGLAGLLGIGGGIVLVPLLLYVPPLLGVPTLTMKEVAGLTIAQVMVASLSGFLTHRRRRVVHWGLGLWMGVPSLAGSWVGGLASGPVSANSLLGLFAFVAAVSGILMFAPVPEKRDVVKVADMEFSPGLAAFSAALVGCLAGMVGVGGAFMLVPVMIYVLGVPTRITIGSSLFIVVLSSVGGFAGKLFSGQVELLMAFCLVAGAWPGARLGANLSHLVPTVTLRRTLGLIILFAAGRIVLDLAA